MSAIAEAAATPATEAEAVATPAASAKDTASAKALIEECCSKTTEAERRGKAAEELRALASRNATAFSELQRSQVVSRSWRLVAASNTPDDAPALCSVRDERRDAILPPVLEALSELALLRSPPLLGQQLSTLPTVMAVCRHCGRPGAPSERAAPERLSLLAALRWLAAVSTHPITAHLLKQGLAQLIVQCLSLRTDQDLLLQCCVLAANVASDGPGPTGQLCRAKVPRLLSRLLVAEGRAEVKEHAVAALNRIANAACGKALDADMVSGPVALAQLASSDRPDCSSEGAWALHVLSTKGGPLIAKKMAATPEVMEVLERRALAREVEDMDVALANKVAQITFEDLTKLTMPSMEAAAEKAAEELLREEDAAKQSKSSK